MERLREKVRNYWSSGFQKYRSLCLIPGTTSYRDIQHEDDVTTSCAHYLTSQSRNDAVHLTSRSCNDAVHLTSQSRNDDVHLTSQSRNDAVHLTSQSCNDAEYLTSQSCNDDVKIMAVSCVNGDDDNAGGKRAKTTK